MHRLSTGRLSRWIAAALLAAAVSCDNPLSPDSAPVARLEVNPGTVQMTVGQTQNITVRVLDANGAAVTRKTFWATQNAAIATVSQNGVVSSVAAGATQIAVSAGGKSAVVPVTVSARPVSQVRLAPVTATLQVGATVPLRADPVDASGSPVTGRPVIWSSSPSTIATVTSTGVVTGIAAGSATITATVDGINGTAAVTVTLVPVATVTVSPGSGTLTVGQTLQLGAATTSAAGQTLSGRVVTWTSSASAIASVSSTGLVSAVSPGTATVTATSEGQSANAQMTVVAVPVASIRVTPGVATVALGKTAQLAAQALDATGNTLNRTIVWTSDQPSIATVSQTGLVTGVNAGVARISASVGTVSGAASLTVTPVPVAALTISPNGATVQIGATQQLTATATDAQGITLPNRVVTWISGAPTVATVTQSGLVTALGAGSAVIFAASEGIAASVTVTVTPVGVATVRVTPNTGNVQQGQTLQLSAAALDAAGNVLTGKTVLWSSSNESIATVSSTGRITAVAPGPFTISASVDGVTGTGSYTATQIQVGTVTVSPSTATLTVGQSLTLTLTLTSLTGTPLPIAGRTIVWSSSNNTVATVGATGLVSALAAGTVTITATTGGVGGSAAITVSLVPVASVTLSPSSPAINVGQQVAITATARDGNLNVLVGRPVTWVSDNPSIVSVNTALGTAGNTIVGVSVGATSVRATVGGVQGSAPVSVTLVPIASISLSPNPTAVEEGQSQTITVTARDAAGNVLTGRTIVFASSNPQVSVSQTGVVSPVINAAGQTATITASAPGGGAGGSTPTATVPVTVTFAPVAATTLAPASLTVNVNGTTSFSPTLRNAAGQTLASTGRTLIWRSLDVNVATVNGVGVVTGIAPGGPITIELTASSPGQTAGAIGTAQVTVSNVPVASVTVSPNPGTVHVGPLYKRTFSAVTRDAGGGVLTGRQIVWTSLNQSVATVDASTGEVTAVAAGGPVAIRATSEGINGDTQVTADLVGISSVAVSPATASMILSVNPTQALSATPFDSAGNVVSGPALGGRGTSWQSSNNPVATVNAASGLVTAVSAGSATITATVAGPGGNSGGAAITVLPPVSSVSLSVSPDTLILPGTLAGIVTVRDGASTPLSGRLITFSSSNPGVATVSPASGLSNASGQVAVTVTGIGAGSATITATSEGIIQTIPALRMLNPVFSATVTTVQDSVIGTGAAPAAATATLRDAFNNVLTGRPIVFASSNTGVATVSNAPSTSPNGNVTVVGLGTTTITASSETRSGPGYSLRVLAPVATVTLAAPGDSVLGAGTLSVAATLRDAASNVLGARLVAWTSSNTGIATVSTTGVVTGISAGTVTITATSEGQSGNLPVRVLPGITAISLTPTGADSLIGAGTIALTATATTTGPLPVPGRILTITSSNPAIATASPSSMLTSGSGQVPITITYVASGNTTLTVSAEGQNASRLLRMLAPVASVSLASPADSVIGTSTVQATPTLRDALSSVLTGRPITWTSSNPAVATVSPTGLITGVTAGTANITATSEGNTSPPLAIRVLAVVNTVTVTAPDSSVFVTQTQQAVAVLRDASANVLTGRLVAWSSDNTSVATVSSVGLITAVAPGSANITAASEGKSGTMPFTVALVPVASITVAPSPFALRVNDGAASTQLFTATLRDTSNTVLTGRTVLWSSSNVAKLSITAGGVATALDSGAVTVTASSSPGTPVSPATGSATVTIALVPVATVVFNPSSPQIVTVGTSANLMLRVKDQNGNNPVGPRACTITSADASKLTASPPSGTTNPSGEITVAITGVASTGGSPVVVTATCEGVVTTISVSVP